MLRAFLCLTNNKNLTPTLSKWRGSALSKIYTFGLPFLQLEKGPGDEVSGQQSNKLYMNIEQGLTNVDF